MLHVLDLHYEYYYCQSTSASQLKSLTSLVNNLVKVWTVYQCGQFLKMRKLCGKLLTLRYQFTCHLLCVIPSRLTAASGVSVGSEF